MDPEIPYLLLTPGPLTTSRGVKEVMLRDFCTWDDEYNDIVTNIRQRLVRLASESDEYTCVLMQGSGTFSVEATIGSVIPPDGNVLIVNNGAYGNRMVQIARRLQIDCVELKLPETRPADIDEIAGTLAKDKSITHVAMVHCETSTGMLNPAAEVGRLTREHDRVYILDAMSSFGGIPMSMEDTGAQFLVSSANKCIQGVPGFGFVIAQRSLLEASKGWARSLSLDLFDQWWEMETKGGKWRYTSPTHVVRAFARALDELDAEGGVAVRFERYCENHRRLVEGYERLGFQPLLPQQWRSPIITSFLYPNDTNFTFDAFYTAMKRRRFVLYPGKVSDADTFRVGTIGHVYPEDIDELVAATADAVEEMKLELPTS